MISFFVNILGVKTAWPACFPFMKRMVLPRILKKSDFRRWKLNRPTRTQAIMSPEERYFQAIYADCAVSKACVNCHNTHLLSPKRDPSPGDVMEGMIISFPVD